MISVTNICAIIAITAAIADVEASRLPYSFDYLVASPDFYDTPATVVFLDYEVQEEVIAKYIRAGKTVFCVVNAGSWEFWREDANIFPAALLGNDYDGWPGEKWLDVRNTDVLLPIIRERFRSAARKGCRGVSADNLFAYKVPNTGFDISPEQQMEYNEYIGAEIRVLKMMAGISSNAEQASELVDNYDFAVPLGCVAENTCPYFEEFVGSGKPVFAVEYTDIWDEEGFKNAVCPLVDTLSFSFVLKNIVEDARFSVSCI